MSKKEFQKSKIKFFKETEQQNLEETRQNKQKKILQEIEIRRPQEKRKRFLD